MKFENVGGSRIVEALTSGLYDGNSNSIREYVQNAVDSHAKLIEIEHLNNGADLRVRDYGDGMNKDELIDALKFGYSKKNVKDDVGWRGIGIYSAVPNFRTIHINTKRAGGKKFHVSILCDEIRYSYLNALTLEQILEKGIPGDIEEFEDSDFKPGTEILLANVELGQEVYFKVDSLRDELIKVLPLPLALPKEKINNEKKYLGIREKIIEHLESSKIIEPDFIIKYNNNQLSRPPIDYELFDVDSLITGIEEAKDGTKLFTYWILTSKANKQLLAPHRGLVFKKKMFTIGDETTFRRVATESYSYWNYGEIHILDKEILENAARNFFEINSGHARELISKVSSFTDDVQRNNRKKSAKDKELEIAQIRLKIDSGKTREAEMQLKKVKESLNRQVTGATSSSLSQYAKDLDDRGNKQLATISTLETLLNSKKVDLSEQEYRKIMDNLPDEYKKMVEKKVKDIHLPVSFNHIMDNIEDAIRKKTNSQKNEFFDMLKEVFRINEGADIKDVKVNAKLFLFDPGLIAGSKPKGVSVKYSYYVTTEFAHMLNALYQIFVNGEKHQREKLGEIFFAGKSNKEIAEFYLDLNHTMSMCQRLVNLTKKKSEVDSLP
ncbi:MAG: ATP-binding protein [Thermoplasmataceae archaeon]